MNVETILQYQQYKRKSRSEEGIKTWILGRLLVMSPTDNRKVFRIQEEGDGWNTDFSIVETLEVSGAFRLGSVCF